MGVITGDICVNGHPRDKAFDRGVGYVMQQDLHLSTSTVREALQFSALLRQHAHIPRQEKLDYVEETLKLMEMDGYADAVVGVPGEGLNVEQRKRLTIAIELVAKPELLLFLDEPSSGLDSDTSLSIVNLLVKLKNESQALVCVIHQPSAILFERFDRLLFLAKGGRTVYFGDIGPQSSIMTNYFERNGSEPCPKGANPAEWMLHVIGAAPGSHSDIDWHETWKGSPEYGEVKTELAKMREELPQRKQPEDPKHNKAAYRQYASSMGVQLVEVTKRIWQQYWRTPSYIYSKVGLCIVAVSVAGGVQYRRKTDTSLLTLRTQSLFIGFSFFKANNSQSGLQNRLFSVFLLFSIAPQLIQQFMPQFVEQRTLYEARERPSKTYSWVAFLFGMIGVELVWNTLMAVVVYCCWYWPIGFNNSSNEAALIFGLCWEFLMFGTTLGFMIISAVDTAENGGNIANLIFTMSLIFCGCVGCFGSRWRG
jgi:ABC-type multidrug transport system ATPase subunit